MTKTVFDQDDPDEPEKYEPMGLAATTFGGWSNEEIGAFIKGILYIENGADVVEVIDTDLAKSLLNRLADDTRETQTKQAAAGFDTRAQWIDRTHDMAEEKFREAFGGHAHAVAASLSTDVHPFLVEALERIKTNDITYSELNLLLSKMVMVASASTLMAIEQVKRL